MSHFANKEQRDLDRKQFSVDIINQSSDNNQSLVPLNQQVDREAFWKQYKRELAKNYNKYRRQQKQQQRVDNREEFNGIKVGRNTNGFVYVICDSNGMTKIGVTVDIEARFTKMKVDCPYELSIHCLIKSNNTYLLEDMLHNKFILFMQRGEWFSIKNYLNLFKEKESVCDMDAYGNITECSEWLRLLLLMERPTPRKQNSNKVKINQSTFLYE